ncbi:putative pyridoxamine 5'-phosphate oxidase family protein [Blattamonas nauphoetae]|uniref:Pyridoxamine 5'-phosphate oxidase family protein n=1 Tax=Blattamonas nauphoetae TaxID=2049346 RepID=A0ABQ9X407_9EUKA|nr:putative pyridoxamine 5'-phosphate oxidase family protein [Blattamonas nauphoetae]
MSHTDSTQPTPSSDHHPMRRRDRALPDEWTWHLIQNSLYGVLSMVSTDNGGYGVPISYAVDGREALYFHGAIKGRKLDNLRQNPKASFCIVGRVETLPEEFSTRFESVIVFGTLTECTGEDKIKGLELIKRKYSPENVEKGINCRSSPDAVCVFKLEISQVTGKGSKLESPVEAKQE